MHSRQKNVLTLVACLTVPLLSGIGAQAQISESLFTGGSDGGNHVNFGSLSSTTSTPHINFGTYTGFVWFPLGAIDFTADFTGTITVPTTGSYIFQLQSDDASYMFLNGTLIVNDGGAHGPATVSSGPQSLTAGVAVPFEVQFWENGSGSSGVDLYIENPNATVLKGSQTDPFFVAQTSGTPEPGSLALLTGLCLSGSVLVRKRWRR